MKIQLPSAFMRALLATFALSYTISSLQAQQTQLPYWDAASIASFSQEMKTLSAPVFGTWDDIINQAGVDATSTTSPGKMFKIPVGSMIINTDGTQTEVQATDEYYIRSGGTLCDAEGNVIVADEKYSSFSNNLILKSDIVVGDVVIYEAGDIILGARPAALGASITNGAYYAALNTAHQSATGSAILVNDHSTAKSGVSNFLSIVGGKLGTSWGSSTAPVESKICIENQFGENYITLQNVFGGNATTDLGMQSSGLNANFTGNTYITAKGGKDAEYSWNSYTTTIDTIVGGNNASANYDSDNFYTANFEGDTHIAIQEYTSINRVIGGNFIQANASEKNPNGNVQANFNGSTYIVVGAGAEVRQIVGGNYGNSANSNVGTEAAPVTTRIDIMSGNSDFSNPYVSSITGASFVNFAADTSFYGDTYINIKTEISGANYNPVRSDNAVLGGFNSLALDSTGNTKLQGTTATLVGDTHINIDIVESYNEFSSSIVGGSFATNGLNVTHTGTAELIINVGNDVNFDAYVVGGNLNGDSDIAQLAKPTEVAYSSADQSYTSIDKVVVKIDGGSFFNNPYNSNGNSILTIGSMTQGGGSVYTGSTEGTITNAQVGILVGGNAAVDNNVTPEPQRGTLTERGSDTTVGTTTIDKINLNVNLSYVQSVVGGSYIGSHVTHVVGDKGVINTQALSVGSVDVKISESELNRVIGGSSIGQHITAGLPQSGEQAIKYTGTQGAINLSITGNTIIEDLEGDEAFVAVAGALEGASVHADEAQYLSNASGIISNDFYENLSENVIGPLTDAQAYSGATGKISSVQSFVMETESTTLVLGKDVRFMPSTQGTTITVSGGYQITNPTINYHDAFPSAQELIYDIDGKIAYTNRRVESGRLSRENADILIEWLNSWKAQIQASEDQFASFSYTHNSIVTGNRQLVMNEGYYGNIDNATFIEFDEINVEDSAVDFVLNNQDLDFFAGRNVLADGATRVSLDSEGKALMSGTNTVRKTGNGYLRLSANNGQLNGKDNLQLVIEAGTVVLSANSSHYHQNDFKTIAVQSGSTLDMSAGDNTVAGAAGINGHLVLEKNAILIADASRYMSGTGTMMTGGALTVDAKFVLELNNMENVHFGENLKIFTSDSLTLNLGYYEILLFSDLDYTNPLNVSGIDFIEGVWGDEEAKIALASDYMESNFYLGNEDDVWSASEVYIIWKANGDFLLTSGVEFIIPEPSTATLSLLALAGLLARRRRKA